MAGLRRHDLVRLSAEGWQQAVAQHDDATIRQCLAHCSSHDWPAVVATQGRDGAHQDDVALGIATPPSWGRRRIGLRVSASALRCGEIAFPRWNDCARQMSIPEPLRAAFDAGLAEHANTIRMYGSFGWQQLTGLSYVTDGSDLDLLLEPANAMHADRMAFALATVNVAGPRLDGELCFPNGSAVAWREWIEWRTGRADVVLVKRLEGPSFAIDLSTLTDEGSAAVAAGIPVAA